MSIDTITLQDMLPRVFEGEHIPVSEVWKCPVTFGRGEFTLIQAASGGGKSSLCSYIYGSRSDFRGRLLFNKEDTSVFLPGKWQALRRLHLAYLPQELMLFPELTALENIRLKNDLTHHFSEDRIHDLMERLGIWARADYPAGRMSIGQQQRLALIRALCQPFDFILLDEPVSHLDEENNRIAAALIAEEARRQGAGIIATSVGNHILLPYDRTLRL